MHTKIISLTHNCPGWPDTHTWVPRTPNPRLCPRCHNRLTDSKGNSRLEPQEPATEEN